MQKPKSKNFKKSASSFAFSLSQIKEHSFSNPLSCSKTKDAVDYVHNPSLFEVFRILMRR